MNSTPHSRHRATCRRGVMMAALALVMLGSGRASAEPPAVRLSYAVERGPAPSGDAGDCPTESELRQAVTRRLGRRPWREDAARVIEVRVFSDGRGVRATVALREAGRSLGDRALGSPGASCRELGAALALAISIAIDPLSVAADEQPTTVATAPGEAADEQPTAVAKAPGEAAEASEANTSRESRRAPARAGPRLGLGLAGVLALGSAPAVAAGLELQVSLRWSRLSIGLEGRVDLPASDVVGSGGGSVSSLLAGGAVLGCGHYRRLFGCALVSLAAIRGRGENIASARSAALPYVAAGARVGADLLTISRFTLRTHAELQVPFGRVTFEDSRTGAPFWRSPALSGSFGLGLLAMFL